MQNLKFDFDDILIIPQVHTPITSRYNDITLPKTFPLFTAPMDTVVDLSNLHKFLDQGIMVCLPRTISIVDALHELKPKRKDDNLDFLENVFPSIGLDDYEHLCHNTNVFKFFKNILIDVANGHMTKKIIHACWHIKETNPDIKIMVGNIANPETYRIYAECGHVDYIRVGIGNGGGCLTTKQSGVGYPMASLINDTSWVKHKMRLENLHKVVPTTLPAIVADGGMKDYADIVKSLALGADFVMLGSIFNKTLESCAPNYREFRNGTVNEIDQETAEKLFIRGEEVRKYFRGMSTKGAQKAMGKTAVKTSEGVERYQMVEYTLSTWVENFNHYLRNAMSYADAATLDDFIGKADFCQITTRAYDRFNK